MPQPRAASLDAHGTLPAVQAATGRQAGRLGERAGAASANPWAACGAQGCGIRVFRNDRAAGQADDRLGQTAAILPDLSLLPGGLA